MLLMTRGTFFPLRGIPLLNAFIHSVEQSLCDGITAPFTEYTQKRLLETWFI